jgi:hypothetical protein
VVARRSLPGEVHTLLVVAVKDAGRRKTCLGRSGLVGRSRRERAVTTTEDVRGRFAFRVRLLQPQARGVGKVETIQPNAGDRARGLDRSIGTNLPKRVQANSSTLSSPLASANSSG